MYYRRVRMTLEEVVARELEQGFDSRDEFVEVVKEIAETYKVTFAEVRSLFYNLASTHKDSVNE